MEEPEWWPKGIAKIPFENSLEGEVITSFGRLNLWNTTFCLEKGWWENQPSEGKILGDWPEVKELEIIQSDLNGILINLNGTHIARISPFEVGDDVSRMARHKPWKQALSEQHVLLPSMIWTVSGNDRIIIYPCSNLLGKEESHSMRFRISESVGMIHRSLDQFSTPNTERRWNDRMNDIEAALKTNTLWRAPHSKFTVGLPRLNLNIDSITLIEGRPYLLPQPRTLAEHLLCQSDRLPGLANLMMLERQWAEYDDPNEQTRHRFLQAWLDNAPPSYSNPKALSTLCGGPWIWRYHATLNLLAQAIIYSDEELEKISKIWLSDVSRLQAHLGVLRFWKSGLWAGVTGLVVAFFSWQLESLSPTISAIIAAISLFFAIGSNQLYWSKDPKPY